MANNSKDITTYFAPAGRSSIEELNHDIEIISKNPVIDSIMKNIGGLLAVLNKNRQVLTVNNTLLATLGINNAEEVLGLRPGEVFKCIHCHEYPNGCGTTKYCSTCGAAIAMVASLDSLSPKEEECVMTAEQDKKLIDLYFKLRSNPIIIDKKPYLLLFIQDITEDKQRAALERAFYHDISNIIQSLLTMSYLIDLPAGNEKQELIGKMKNIIRRLSKEITIQRTLSRMTYGECELSLQEVTPAAIVQELKEIISTHPAAKNKSVIFSEPFPQRAFKTDVSLVIRILMNMLINAFEATEDKGEIRMWIDDSGDSMIFCVWNKAHIPENIALRIFQRNYSTKKESGRGMGTFAVKMFAEKYLGGKADFTTSVTDGTIFRLSLP